MRCQTPSVRVSRDRTIDRRTLAASALERPLSAGEWKKVKQFLLISRNSRGK